MGAVEKYLEDFIVGEEIDVGQYDIVKEEMIAFASKWDPQPIHIDEEAAKRSAFKGLIAPGCYLIALSIALINKAPSRPNIIAAIGWDEIRFLEPVRPGDRLYLTWECLEARPSESKPDRGVVRNLFRLKNEKGKTVFTFKDHIIVRKKH